MYFWPQVILIFGLVFVLFFSTGCTTSSSSHRLAYAPPPLHREATDPMAIPYKVNAELENMREKNFSVLRTEMAMRGMSMDNPMLIRAFKTEMKMELWVQSSYSPQYELFRTYNICKKSGALGPKIKEGDGQTPEGFYNVTEDRLNPNSQYFLSFNIGYPNEYDRAQKRTGSMLMIHGDCVSIGCLAMTNEQIGEIYLIVENNFKYGHKSIPINIYPFRMTAENMALRRNSNWYPFWQDLKQGYDYFERYRSPVDVSVKDGRYAFNKGAYY